MLVNREFCIYGVGVVVIGLVWGWLFGIVVFVVRYLGRSEFIVYIIELRNIFC